MRDANRAKWTVWRSKVVLCGGTAVVAAALFAHPQDFLPAPVADPGVSPSHVMQDASIERGVSGRTGFAAIVDNVKPAVIDIRARALDDDASGSTRRGAGDKHAARAPRFSTSQGTGFFITADGYAVTNEHVIKGSRVAEIRTDSGETYKADVVGEDPASDLALLKVQGRTDFPHVRFADASPHIGDWIIAIGNPFGLGGTVTAGIVSARGRDLSNDKYEDLIQIDAPVNKGNSGGPTFDLQGEVIGVNTMIISPTGGSVGIAFAIPSERVKHVVEQLKGKGSVTRGWLGIQFQSVSRELAENMGLARTVGILVADVRPGSPAARAGLTVGDVIFSINNDAIENAHAFNRILDDVAPGTAVTLGAVHAGKDTFVEAVVGTAPAPETQTASSGTDVGDSRRDRQQLGLLLSPPDVAIGSEGRGATVASVDPGGLAAGRGISPGDIILDAANQAVMTPDDVYKRFAEAQKSGKRSILLRVKSGDLARFIALPIV